MKHVCKLVLIALTVTLVFGVGMAVSATDEVVDTQPPVVEGEGSPFGLYVGGIAVTRDNMTDILEDIPKNSTDMDGEEVSPRAFYVDGEDEGHLYLSGNILLDRATTVNGVGYAVFSSNTEKNIRVTISKRSDITLTHGIEIALGSFEVEEGSTLTFKAVGNTNVSALVNVKSGEIVMEGCHVDCTSTDMIGVVDAEKNMVGVPAGVCYAADRISINNSELKLLAPSRETPLHAVFWANDAFNIKEDSSVFVMGTSAGCFADVFLHAGKRAEINDANVIVFSSVGCVMDLPEADFSVRDGSLLYSTLSSCGMLLGGESRIEDSTVNMTTCDGGIVVTGEGASFRTGNGVKITINESNETFDVSPREHTWDGYVSAAIYFEKCPVNMRGTNVTTRGYTYGILTITGGEKNTFIGQYNMSAKVAFFATAEKRGDINFGSSVSGDAKLHTISARGTLGALGDYAVALVPTNRIELAVTGVSIARVDDLHAAFSGYAAACNVESKAFPFGAIIVPCVFILVAVAVIIVLYKTDHINGRRKKGTEKTVQTPASDIPATEDTQDAQTVAEDNTPTDSPTPETNTTEETIND